MTKLGGGSAPADPQKDGGSASADPRQGGGSAPGRRVASIVTALVLTLTLAACGASVDGVPSAVPAPIAELVAAVAVDDGPLPAATTSSVSTNWSGYAATGGTFTSVTATWTVPTVSATVDGVDATWVGIGGIDTSDLIQAGTQAVVSGGVVEYTAWFEMLPASSQTVPLSVSAGDSITVTVRERSTGEWVIEIENDTTGDRYDRTVRYASSRSSAEWVQEAPSGVRGLFPLSDFGTLRFSDASAVRDGRSLDLASLDAEAITMVNGAREALVVPSILGADGASFSVTRTDATSTPLRVPGQRRHRA